VKVVIVLSNEGGEKRQSDDAQAAAFGGIRETAFTIPALKAVLAKYPHISELGLLSHGAPDGAVFIGEQRITLNELTTQIHGQPGAKVDAIQWLGCSVGNDPKGMASLAQALGAKTSEGFTCNVRAMSASPVTDLKGTPLTSVEAIKKHAGEGGWANAIRKNAKAAMKEPARTGCILGFSPATSIDSVPDDKIGQTYDQHKGVLTAQFTSMGETCTDLLSYDKEDDVSHCKRTKVGAAGTGGPPDGGAPPP
jgi:hypothetical protein